MTHWRSQASRLQGQAKVPSLSKASEMGHSMWRFVLPEIGKCVVQYCDNGVTTMARKYLIQQLGGDTNAATVDSKLILI